MKLARLVFVFISIFIYSIASAEINVNVLTRGGWECGAQWCYFFEADGSCDVVGSLIVPMKWIVEQDGSIKLSDSSGNIEYVDVNGSSMRWRDGREGYHRPFAEKDNEIKLRNGRKYADKTWQAPHSANALADKLYLKSWISDTRDRCIIFISPDTCLVSNISRLNINQKYLWQPLDAESIRLTSLIPPYESETVKVNTYPGGFDLTDNGATRRYLLNAYSKMDALGAVLDMCLFPLGCHGFYLESPEEVKSYFKRTFPEPKGVTDYSIYVVGERWTCDGVVITSDERSVSYVNYPGDNAAVEKSFQNMTIILNNLFTPADIQMDENTRIFIDQSPGGQDSLLITLAKTPVLSGSCNGIESGKVKLNVCSK